MEALPDSLAIEFSTGDERCSDKSDRLARGWRRHRYILGAIVPALLVCAWFCSWADWKFFEPEQFCQFYDAQAISLLDGRLDVPPAAIGTEAFIVGGKTYGYFGIAPALLRLPLVIAFEGMDGRWSRLMMMIAAATNLFCAYHIVRAIRGHRVVTTWREKLLDLMFILCAGIGSTNVFLVARSFTFHEAIMWAGTFALLFTCVTLKYLARPRRRLLALAGCCAFMSFLSRPTVGAGALLGLGVLLVALLWSAARGPALARRLLSFNAPERPLPHAAIVAATAIITLGVYFGVNYGKFGSFNGVPLQHYYYYKLIPVRMQITGGKQIHPENVPTALASYFGLRGFAFEKTFPWFERTRRPTIIGKPALDMVDGFSSFPVSMPALTLLAAFGAWTILRGRDERTRRLRLPAAVLLVGGGIVLATVALCERYLHDFYPALVLLAAAGLWALQKSGKHTAWKIAALATLTTVSIVLNCSFALTHQRLGADTPAEKVAEFRHWQSIADGYFQREPATAESPKE
jgi:hypothetical protein